MGSIRGGADDRIGKGIDYFNRKQHGAGRGSRNAKNIRVKEHQEDGDIGPIKIEPQVGNPVTDLFTPGQMARSHGVSVVVDHSFAPSLAESSRRGHIFLVRSR
jgi:hypothetical protein